MAVDEQRAEVQSDLLLHRNLQRTDIRSSNPSTMQLSTDKRTHQVRQNKKGVFVQGLRECRLFSYKQGMELIMEGENSRRIALTTMNTQSSRSHVIFTIYIESEIAEDDRVITKKSKLNVIDLAGSERIKHTNVEG